MVIGILEPKLLEACNEMVMYLKLGMGNETVDGVQG